jgi:cobalamin biosynthesis Mg chelatase CobN
MIRERRPRSSSAGRGRAIRPRSRSGCSQSRHRICAEARLAVRTRTAGLTAVDVDRALSDERSLAVTWPNRGTLQQKQKAPSGSPKPSATAANPAPRERTRRPTRSFTQARACTAASSHGSRARSPEREPFPSQRRPAHVCEDGSARRRVGNVPQRKDHVPTWLWIVIIIVVALAILGYFGRGRFSR